MHFTAPAAKADPSHLKVLEQRMKLVVEQPGFQLYRVLKRNNLDKRVSLAL